LALEEGIAMDISDDIKTKLGKLSADARSRIEAALKETVDEELAVEAGQLGPGGKAAAFSRGIFFSKSTRSISLDEVILPELAEMDEAKFKSFMERIAVLKGTRTTKTGG
jgi:hypothetical protein